MRFSATGILGRVLPAFLLLSGDVHAADAMAKKPEPAAMQAPAPAEPNLGDIIPLATALSGRLANLEARIQALRDAASIERDFSTTRRRIDAIARHVTVQKGAAVVRYGRYVRLKEDLAQEAGAHAVTSKTLADTINRLDRWGREWRTEKARWSGWRVSLLTDRPPEELEFAFTKAFATIDAAQEMVAQHLKARLALQAQGAEVESKMDRLSAELQGILAETRERAVLDKSPPMYSTLYFSQFRTELWDAAWDRVTLITWPDRRLFDQHGLALSLLFMLFLGTAVVIHLKRQALRKSERWRFLADKPMATAFFTCALPAAFALRLGGAPVSLTVINLLVGGIACVRLLGGVLGQVWMKQAAYGVMIAHLLSMTLYTLNTPAPLLRLYIFTASLLAVIYCLRWANAISAGNEPRVYAWVLRLIAILSVVVLVAQFLGYAPVAAYLFVASLTTMATILPVILFIHMIRGVLHWVFFVSPVWQVRLLRDEAAVNVRKVSFLIEAAILVFGLVPAVLTAWGIFDSFPDAVSGILAPGFDVGSKRISIGLILIALGTLYGSLLAGAIIPRVLLDQQFGGRNMDRGARLSVGRLLQYFIVLVGFLIVLSMVGLDWTNLTILLSAFGVGIGFGLQSIVNNFVSGLILLFERPLREGDTIEIGTERVHIKKIGLRATHVQTFEQADVIVPNADLVTHPVTNWTLGDREVRLSVPVGVSYGSDVPLVGETLLSCAKAHAAVLPSPPPEVLFMNLGESSLNLELRVWIKDADQRLSVRSQLYLEIVRRFRESNIDIPFPQRDLHLRSVDESIVERALQHAERPSGP